MSISTDVPQLDSSRAPSAHTDELQPSVFLPEQAASDLAQLWGMTLALCALRDRHDGDLEFVARLEDAIVGLDSVSHVLLGRAGTAYVDGSRAA